MDLSTLNLRKAALLITTLDQDAADRLLDQLPEEQAQLVRDTILSLTTVDGQEQQEVMREFLRDERGYASLHDEPLLAVRGKHAVQPGSLESADVRGTPQPGGPLDRASERRIAECLSEEMPQTIAVALAQLPTHRASEVVSYLPASVQTEVLERLVELEPSNAWEFPEIRIEFQQWLEQQIERSLHRAELATRLATILEVTHTGTRERILHNVAQSDTRLAKELQHQLAGFAESA